MPAVHPLRPAVTGARNDCRCLLVGFMVSKLHYSQTIDSIALKDRIPFKDTKNLLYLYLKQTLLWCQRYRLRSSLFSSHGIKKFFTTVSLIRQKQTMFNHFCCGSPTLRGHYKHFTFDIVQYFYGCQAFLICSCPFYKRATFAGFLYSRGFFFSFARES